MEDLLSNLTEVAVTEHPNTPYAEHPYFSLYKVKRSGSSQDERRKRVLEARKEARYDLLNHLRNIEEENAATESSSSDDSMEYEKERVCYKKPKKYRNFLMLSEWLVDVPEDFATSYLSVLCPVGKRTLIVSARGRTRAYTKSGIMVNQFPSLLPGGCYHSKRKGYALLDCIWSITEKTFFVLDLVVWLNQSIMECETQFRFEWLKSRMLEETPDAAEISQYNPYKFVSLPYYDCTTETLTRLVNEPLPFPVSLDGILFYHKESHYTHGPTPLVGWLKAYMFPEILGINQVAQVHMSERPARYISLPAHIQYGKDKQQQKQEALKNKMDVSAENIKSTRENGKKVQEVRKNEGDSIDTMQMEVSAERKKSPREKGKKDQGVRENEGNSRDTMMEVSSQKKKKPKEKKKKSKDSQESQMETMVT